MLPCEVRVRVECAPGDDFRAADDMLLARRQPATASLPHSTTMLGLISSTASEASSNKGECSTRQPLPTAELTNRAAPSQAPIINKVLRMVLKSSPPAWWARHWHIVENTKKPCSRLGAVVERSLPSANRQLPNLLVPLGQFGRKFRMPHT